MEAAKRVKYLWIEDAYTGGILRKAAGVDLHPFDPLFPAQWNIDGVNVIPDYRMGIAYSHAYGRDKSLWLRMAGHVANAFLS